MRYPRTYRLLKAIGHTPLKAAEIVLDASRGDDHAMAWVRVAFGTRSNYAEEKRSCPSTPSTAPPTRTSTRP